MSAVAVDIPCSVKELVGDLKRASGSTKLLAGGTDLVIALNEGRIKPSRLIDLSGIEEIRTIEEKDGALHIGACATYSEIAKNDLVGRYFSSLSQAAGSIGTKQIRNRGTIAGNLANASPAGDMIPTLLSLAASVITVNSDNLAREISIADLITGAGTNSLAVDEAILFIKVPIPPKERMTKFVKLGNRNMVAIARLSIAVNFGFADDGKIADAIIALGAVGKKAFRAKMAEEAIVGKKITEDTKELLAEALMAEVEKSIPGRASLAYKKEAIRGKAYDIFA